MSWRRGLWRHVHCEHHEFSPRGQRVVPLEEFYWNALGSWDIFALFIEHASPVPWFVALAMLFYKR